MGQSIRTEILILFLKIYRPNAVAPTVFLARDNFNLFSIEMALPLHIHLTLQPIMQIFHSVKT